VIGLDGTGAASARRALAAIAASTVVLAVMAGQARADGDPASDVLLEQNVYFPYRAPSAAMRSAMRSAISAT